MSARAKILVPTTRIGRLPTCPEHVASRRSVLKMALALGAVSLTGALRSALAEDAPGFDPSGPMPTPDQILGPFYPVQKPTDGGSDLTHLRGRSGR